jgi:predicted nuclease with TOPRIM domain
MDAQFTMTAIAATLPSLTALIGILLNNSRLGDLRHHVDSRFNEIDRRFNEIDRRMSRMEHSIDVLTGKVVEIDNRLTRVEERLKIN